MRTARLALLGLVLALLSGCGTSEMTAPKGDGPTAETQKRSCGYLGSAGCR